MLAVLNIINHVLPAVITLCLVGVVAAFVWGAPYLQYIALLSKAGTDEGREELAKYLARRPGGRRTDVQDMWQSFITPAQDIHRAHMRKRSQL